MTYPIVIDTKLGERLYSGKPIPAEKAEGDVVIDTTLGRRLYSGKPVPPAPAKAALPETYEYSAVRETYAGALTDAFMGYASSGGPVTSWRNAAGRAVIEAVADAVYRAFDDAGADELDPDDESWLSDKQTEQRGFLPDTFEWLKEARDDESITEVAVADKVERWAQTLDSIYSEALLRGKKNQLLEWRYGDTDHCETCASLNGQRHRASWYLARDYIPGKPGAAMECGGYRCQCVLLDKQGNEVTI